MEEKKKEKIKESFGKKCLISLLIILFPVLMLFILGPVEVYYGNITDFEFLISDFIYLFLGMAVIALLVGSIVLALLPKKIRNILHTIILAGSLMCYIQYIFLNKQLAMADGTVMHWDEMKDISTQNAVLWGIGILVLFVGIFFLQKKAGEKTLVGVSVALSLILLSAIVTCFIGISNSGKIINHYQISGKNQMKVASNENIIVLSLDSTERKVFDELCAKDPSFVDNLQDFTYYNQYDSLYLFTFPSLIHMLTGSNPDTSVNRMIYMKNAWTSDTCESFYKTLHDNKYVCNVYTDGQSYVFGNVEYMKGKFDNLENAERITDNRLMIPMMLKYSLYTYAPYILKSKFEVIPEHFKGAAFYEDGIAYLNEAYYKRLIDEKLEIESEWENAFIYEHLQGAHKPMNINKDASYKENASEEEVFYGLKHICNEYFDQLKKLGLYDTATIIIVSDHGHSIQDGPIFMIKRSNEHHDSMQVSTAPITSDDFIPSILEIIGEDYTDYGTSISDWKDGEVRERTRLETSDGFSGYTYYESEKEILDKTDYDVIDYRNDW